MTDILTGIEDPLPTKTDEEKLCLLEGLVSILAS